jgi:hypothetical protein
VINELYSFSKIKAASNKTALKRVTSLIILYFDRHGVFKSENSMKTHTERCLKLPVLKVSRAFKEA